MIPRDGYGYRYNTPIRRTWTSSKDALEVPAPDLRGFGAIVPRKGTFRGAQQEGGKLYARITAAGSGYLPVPSSGQCVIGGIGDEAIWCKGGNAGAPPADCYVVVPSYSWGSASIPRGKAGRETTMEWECRKSLQEQLASSAVQQASLQKQVEAIAAQAYAAGQASSGTSSFAPSSTQAMSTFGPMATSAPLPTSKLAPLTEPPMDRPEDVVKPPTPAAVKAYKPDEGMSQAMILFAVAAVVFMLSVRAGGGRR